MSAFDRPQPEDIPADVQLRWWCETCAVRAATRADKLSRGLMPLARAQRDARMEEAIRLTLEHHNRLTAIAFRATAPQVASCR